MVFNRKEYDRNHARQLYIEFKARKLALVERFGGKCEVCGTNEHGMHLHHIVYHPTESNYPKHSKAMNVRWKRLKEAEAHPERFQLLCSKCHIGIEQRKLHRIPTREVFVCVHCGKYQETPDRQADANQLSLWTLNNGVM